MRMLKQKVTKGTKSRAGVLFALFARFCSTLI